MKKALLILPLLLTVACSQPVNVVEFKEAESLCRDRGGLSHIDAYGIGISVECKNGQIITFLRNQVEGDYEK